MVEGGDQRRMGAGEGLEAMTLEDFLAKAGAVREEDVRGVPTVVPGHASFRVDAAATAAAINGGAQFPMPTPVQVKEGSSIEVFGNGIDGTVVGVAASAGRGKRRIVEEPVDRATLQKQRRMIKNRESAARSRERKQAYTVELETMVTQLEAENAQLSSEMAEKEKQRFKQLMENLIPVVEKHRPQRKIRRVNSAHW
ncbi:bZIP transcription factor 12-like [Neltuma alba]|nr:bZIP transcription factor 12-like [Prosopis alba]